MKKSSDKISVDKNLIQKNRARPLDHCGPPITKLTLKLSKKGQYLMYKNVLYTKMHFSAKMMIVDVSYYIKSNAS